MNKHKKASLPFLKWKTRFLFYITMCLLNFWLYKIDRWFFERSLFNTPSSNSITRCGKSRIICQLWLATITATPIWLMRLKTFMISRVMRGSKFPIGSSAKRIFGRFTRARAIAPAAVPHPNILADSDRLDVPVRPLPAPSAHGHGCWKNRLPPPQVRYQFRMGLNSFILYSLIAFFFL